MSQNESKIVKIDSCNASQLARGPDLLQSFGPLADRLRTMAALQSIDYEALEASKTQEVKEGLTLKLKAKTYEAGKIDSLKRSILGYVASESYDVAKDALRGYVHHKSDFPQFQDRVSRYVDHCCDLIQAIELKRNFPGVSSLTFSKQQEIYEGVLKHFEELKSSLTSIQRIERELKLEDLRSTAWFLRTLSHCLFLVTSVAFGVAISNGLGRSFLLVVDQVTSQISDALVRLLGL